MAAHSRISLTVTVFATIALVVAGVAFYRGMRDTAPPTPAAAPVGITVRASDIKTVPDVGSKTLSTTTKELALAVMKLYTRAFTRPLQATPTTSPSPSPARRMRDLMTGPAVAALEKSPGVFDLGPLIVTNGRATFGGVVTFNGKEPVGALLDVNFLARATPTASSASVADEHQAVADVHQAADVHQEGTISLRRTSDGWLVDGFDLRIASRPESTPTPGVP